MTKQIVYNAAVDEVYETLEFEFGYNGVQIFDIYQDGFDVIVEVPTDASYDVMETLFDNGFDVDLL